jgi:hypothetical protein
MWVNVKGEYFFCFSYHIYPALGQAKLESFNPLALLERGLGVGSGVFVSLVFGKYMYFTSRRI